MTGNEASLLRLPVSYFTSTWAPPSSEQSVQDTLRAIREGIIHDRVNHLRGLLAAGQHDQYTAAKRRLPAVTFSATFSRSRKAEDVTAYNPLLVLDVDHLAPDDLTGASDCLKTIPCVLASWLSPSAQGLKGLIGLSFPDAFKEASAQEKHRSAFDQVASHLASNYNIILDRSGSDITRLCFLSSDHDLHLHATASLFPVSTLDALRDRQGSIGRSRDSDASPPRPRTLARNVLYRTEGKNKAQDRKAMTSILKYLEKRRLSITYSYAQWLRVGYAIATAFSYDVGIKYYLRLCRLDGGNHDELASVHLLQSCYLTGKGLVRMGTIRHLASRAGYMNAGDGG